MQENLEIRPKNFEQFIGQQRLVETLKVLISSSRKRKKPLDHILFYGSPGTGKTTLANILATETQSKIKYIQGPLLEKKSDILSMLANVEKGHIIFIDEIHSINKNIEELLYSAMEEFVIDIQIGVEGESKIMRMKLPEFTLVGASTKISSISLPLKNRFGLTAKIYEYTSEEMKKIIQNSSNILNIEISEELVHYVVDFTNKTPRIANNLLKRIRDFAIVEDTKTISKDIIDKTFNGIGIFLNGLNLQNIEYLNLLANIFKRKTVSLDVICGIMKETKENIINNIEPILLQLELIEKTPRGRKITQKGLDYLISIKK